MEERNKGMSKFTAVLLMIALSVCGIALIPSLNIQYTPVNSSRSLNISYSYAEASAEAIESEVTSIIEGTVAGISGITDISSTSTYGSGSINVTFRKGTDMEGAKFEIASAIRNIWSGLPEGVSYPLVRFSGQGSTSYLTYRIKGDIPSNEISKYASNHLVSEISAIPGVDEVSVSGGTPFQWVITIDSDKAASAGISAAQIAEAVSYHYAPEIIGTATTAEGLMTVWLGESQGKDFGDVPIMKAEDRVIHLRDIASWSYRESQPLSYFRVNGLNTVSLSVGISPTANLIKTSSAVRDRMAELQESFPGELSASLSYDASRYISDELHRIYRRTALCVAILLLFVLLISRSWRYTAIILSTLTVNILSAIAIYGMAGLNIHIYTLAGITVSLGIIIDTSIVMTDHYSRWKNMKVFPAILSAIATTVGALMVILLLPESERANLEDFAWVIVINLGLSLVISYLFIPSLIEYLPPKGKEGSGSPAKKRRYARWNNLYAKYIGWGIGHRWVYIIALVIVFGIPTYLIPYPLSDKEKASAGKFAKMIDKIATWGPYQKNRSEIDRIAGSSSGMFHRSLEMADFYRQPQKKVLGIHAGMPEGCTVQQLNEVVRAMENYLAGFDEISVFTTSITSPSNATISVEFKPEYESTGFPLLLKSEVTRMAVNFGGANWRVYGVDDNSFNNYIQSGYKNSRISLSGYNYQELRRYAEYLCEYLSGNRRVDEPEIWSGGQSYSPPNEFVLDYDFGRMTAAGVNPYEYYNALSSLLYEKIIGNSPLSGDLSDVVLKSSGVDTYDLWHIVNTPLSVGENKISLSNFGSIEKRRTGASITRQNQSYSLDVCYDFQGSPNLAKRTMEAAIDHMNNEILPLGYKADNSGDGWFVSQKNNYVLLILLVIAVIYIILSISFESLRYPLSVILMIPASFIGIFLVFGLSDYSFDQGGFAAFVMICGIVVNAGIYLIYSYKDLLKKEHGAVPMLSSRIKLYVKAFSQKITPISLTIISTILGLLPFLSDGPEDVFWFDFAAGTIAGISMSIIAVILLLPVFSISNHQLHS